MLSESKHDPEICLLTSYTEAEVPVAGQERRVASVQDTLPLGHRMRLRHACGMPACGQVKNAQWGCPVSDVSFAAQSAARDGALIC